MSSIIQALDNYTPTQVGENGHTEYGWSNNMQEQILQFSFQLTRTSDDGIRQLRVQLTNMLKYLTNTIKTGSISEKQLAIGYLSILYRMVGHTRDIIDGKGECTLTYMMICVWYDFYPELAKFALKCLVFMGDKSIHQYGSWKDIKYCCQYLKNTCLNETHPLINYAIELTNTQLTIDYEALLAGSDSVTLVSKWIPREKSAFGWLYNQLATSFFSYIDTAKTVSSRSKAILKSKTEYRKILSKLNKKLDTLQIKQCNQEWSNIDFGIVTSISLTKQKKAFQNIKHNGEIRHSDNEDRIVCANNFKSHIKKAIEGGNELKGSRVSMVDFTKQALSLHLEGSDNKLEMDLLNSQWRDSSSLNGKLGNMIPMVDTSGSMSGDPLHAAIALGIRIAEKSAIGKRVMTFNTKPTWVNLEGCDDFVSQVGAIHRGEWGMNTNFHAALDMILNVIIQNKLPPEEVQDMVLVVLSDMQMDQGDNCDKSVLYDTMKRKYAEAGHTPPHILFWNLRNSSGFPSLSSQSNCSMMSGFSPALLNSFCDQGMASLQACTPWSVLEKSLENDRYQIMGDKFAQEISM